MIAGTIAMNGRTYISAIPPLPAIALIVSGSCHIASSMLAPATLNTAASWVISTVLTTPATNDADRQAAQNATSTRIAPPVYVVTSESNTKSLVGTNIS